VKNLKPLIVLLSILGFSSFSQAGLLVEPVVGYTLNNKFESEYTTVDGVSGTGPSIGGRLGYQNMGFQLGVDYLRSALTIDEPGLDDSVSMTEWAGFVGLKLPILLRVYLGYILSANAEGETSAGSKLEFSKGSGVKVGVGFTGLPFININLEYRKGTFDEFKIAGIKSDTEIDYSAVMLGVSLPLNF
jgi:hypothetical protein